MDITLYNTLSKQKEVLKPLYAGKVSMYTCGQTVYDYTHIGNYRAYVFSDTLRRTLEQFGYEVKQIINITDVGHLTEDDIAQGDQGEDKIARKAHAEGKSPEAIAEFFETYYHQGESKLNIKPAHFYPRATSHIEQMIKMIEVLIEKGHAYEVNGNVFFDVTTFKNYGKLSGNTLSELQVGARLEAHPDKRNPWDFALWLKAPKEHLMKWPSPWGFGYPGWHIECSAMSQEYLGSTFDIHTGGEDHIFPHHEAEIAQSEGASGKTFANMFLHIRHMMINDEKMSKSKGNFLTLEDIREKGFDAMDVRLTYLGAHYRSQMNFTDASLIQARKNKEKLFSLYERFLQKEAEVKRPLASKRLDTFFQALADDLNTPLALAEALQFGTEYHKKLDQKEDFLITEVFGDLQIIFELFGLRYERVQAPERVIALAQKREEARQLKNFSESDRIRKEIEELGYVIKDTEGGFEVTKK